ncbi:MAG: hypothetical protein P4L67_01425 [Candidatus Pacebacteria bacterium]|nr:hypothetical protein [Candidatus Paceibacterota bacterium]
MENQILARWDTIPDNLRDALTSSASSDFIWDIATKENVPKEKIRIVAGVAGYVLLGFLHPDDLAQELVKQAAVDPKSATAIQNALRDRIFAPLKQQIDTVYQTADAMPKSTIIKDVNGPRIIATAIPGKTPTPPPLPLQALSGAGWSKMKPGNVPPRPPVPPQSAVGEFARLKVQPAASGTIPMPVPTPAATPSPSSAPAPVMLRQETPFGAAQKNADFHIAKSDDGAQREFSTAKEPIRVMPAVIEFNKGAVTAPKQAMPSAPSPQPARYTEFKSSLASIPVTDSGARKVTEVTSAPTPAPARIPVPIPKPPTPPAAAPAMPAANPSATPKVIVQDFLQQPPK